MIIFKTLGAETVKISFKVVIDLLAIMAKNASQIIIMSLSRVFSLKISAIGRSDRVSSSMRKSERVAEEVCSSLKKAFLLKQEPSICYPFKNQPQHLVKGLVQKRVFIGFKNDEMTK